MARAVSPGLALSYVNRVDGRVHLRLHLPHFAEPDPAGVRVKVVNGSQSRTCPASMTQEQSGIFLDATLPAGRLRNGAWAIRISPNPGSKFLDTGSRVFVCDPNPIALLMGDPPPSVVPPPLHTLPVRQQRVKRAARVMDRVLTQLPPQRADSTRRALRHLARRMIPS